jgi:putative zinc finger protein
MSGPIHLPASGGIDHAYISEADVSARYVRHRLSTDEEQRFEAHLVDCSTCQDVVEHELALRDGLRALSISSRPDVPASRVGASRFVPALALAASALLVVAGAMAFQLQRIVRQRDVAKAEAADARQKLEAETSAARVDLLAQAAVFELTMTRGGDGSSPANRVRVDGAKWIVLTVDLARPADSDQFVATLRSATSPAATWSGGPFKATTPDALTLALHASLFQPGDFVLTVDRRLADGRATPEGRYTFRVMPTER